MVHVFYIFIQNFNRPFCKQKVEILIRRRVLRRLIWVCTVLSMSHKKDARPIWAKILLFSGGGGGEISHDYRIKGKSDVPYVMYVLQ